MVQGASFYSAVVPSHLPLSCSSSPSLPCSGGAEPQPPPPPERDTLEKKRGDGPAAGGHRSYKYAALDLDGTLLNNRHVLSDRTKDTLRRLTTSSTNDDSDSSGGFRIMIATGRAISTVYEHLLDLNLGDGIALPVVCSNGAQGRLCTTTTVMAEDTGDGDATTATTSAITATTRRTVQSTMLFSLSVPLVTVQMTIDLARKLNLVVQYYVDDDIYANPAAATTTTQGHENNNNDWQMELCQKYTVLTGSKTIYVHDDFATALQQQGLPSKLLILCPKDRQDEVMAQLERTFQNDTLLAAADRPHLVRGYLGWFIEILPPNVNKGSGLARMCAHLNIALDDVVAFGDGDNDLEFIQQAGWGIVMKNGRPVVKEVADEVIDWTNNEDGVARTLEAMEARQQLSQSHLILLL